MNHHKRINKSITANAGTGICESLIINTQNEFLDIIAADIQDRILKHINSNHISSHIHVIPNLNILLIHQNINYTELDIEDNKYTL